MNYPILIDDINTVARVLGTETEEQYKRAYIEASFVTMKNAIARELAKANLGKPHIIRFKLEVHAQEVDE